MHSTAAPNRAPLLATLAYLRRDGRVLMVHRIKKANDIHEGKWNGLGGKFETGETPQQCVLRELKEESGLDVRNPRLAGILTFPDFAIGRDWYVFVYTATDFEGDLIDSPEGRLEWVEEERLLDLPLWEGDRIFLPWVLEGRFFDARFEYRDGHLAAHEAALYDAHPSGT